jgi:hypothetical protein
MGIIVGALITLLLAGFAWATNKLRDVGRDAAAVVEKTSRNGTRMTPTERMNAAIKHVRGTDGVFTSIVPAALIRLRVQDVVDSARVMERAKSDPPPSMLDTSAIEDADTLPIKPVKR